MTELSNIKCPNSKARLRLHVTQDLLGVLVQPSSRRARPKLNDSALTPFQRMMWGQIANLKNVQGRAGKHEMKLDIGLGTLIIKLKALWPDATITCTAEPDNTGVIEIILPRKRQ